MGPPDLREQLAKASWEGLQEAGESKFRSLVTLPSLHLEQVYGFLMICLEFVVGEIPDRRLGVIKDQDEHQWSGWLVMVHRVKDVQDHAIVWEGKWLGAWNARFDDIIGEECLLGSNRVKWVMEDVPKLGLHRRRRDESQYGVGKVLSHPVLQGLSVDGQAVLVGVPGT